MLRAVVGSAIVAAMPDPTRALCAPESRAWEGLSNTTSTWPERSLTLADVQRTVERLRRAGLTGYRWVGPVRLVTR